MASGHKSVIVVGAGIVGVSTAIWLQRAGHSVTLIDRIGPAGGASYGNGGMLASCSVVPVPVPGLVRKAPRMLLDPNQPLFLKYRYLPRLLPWLARYLARANERDARTTAQALYGIVSDSLADHQALAHNTGAERWIVPSDYLYVYSDRVHYLSDSLGWTIRRDLGFVWDELEGQDLRNYDPVFAKSLGFAVKLAKHGRISDPGAYVTELARHVVRKGGRQLKGVVSDVIHRNGKVTGVRADGQDIQCDAVVIAAGAWSGQLAARLGIRVPLETERGYHIDLWEPSVMPRSPVMVTSGKFVMTPMEGRLRLAGIVEFGGLRADPSRAPFGFLKKTVRAALPGIKWGNGEEWMGHRPATTDSIPVIGEVPFINGAYFGFGHHHIGLTGGPKTGWLLAQMISRRSPNLDMGAYSPKRFVT